MDYSNEKEHRRGKCLLECYSLKQIELQISPIESSRTRNDGGRLLRTSKQHHVELSSLLERFHAHSVLAIRTTKNEATKATDCPPPGGLLFSFSSTSTTSSLNDVSTEY